MAVKDLLGSKLDDESAEYKQKGMGTPVAEYSESGPFSCLNCWYLKSTEPRKETHGLCSEPHMLKDPAVKKVSVDEKSYAIVNKFFGCCRYVDPVDPGERSEEFTFVGDSEEESEE